MSCLCRPLVCKGCVDHRARALQGEMEPSPPAAGESPDKQRELTCILRSFSLKEQSAGLVSGVRPLKWTRAHLASHPSTPTLLLIPATTPDPLQAMLRSQLSKSVARAPVASRLVSVRPLPPPCSSDRDRAATSARGSTLPVSSLGRTDPTRWRRPTGSVRTLTPSGPRLRLRPSSPFSPPSPSERSAMSSSSPAILTTRSLGARRARDPRRASPLGWSDRCTEYASILLMHRGALLKLLAWVSAEPMGFDAAPVCPREGGSEMAVASRSRSRSLITIESIARCCLIFLLPARERGVRERER